MSTGSPQAGWYQRQGFKLASGTWSIGHSLILSSSFLRGLIHIWLHAQTPYALCPHPHLLPARCPQLALNLPWVTWTKLHAANRT